jgi:fumarate reductase subunit C
MSTYWWIGRWSYFAFILRELTSVFVAWSVIFVLLLIRAANKGAESYARFLEWSAHPLVMWLNVVTLVMLMYHAVTWFNLAPQALKLRWRGERVGDKWIAGGNYGAWAVISLVIFWLVMRG